MKKQVLVADQEVVKKVSLANEKLDASLTREEVTKAAVQKTTDVLEINWKSKVRDNGKQAAQALEDERNTLWKEVYRQDEKSAKLLGRENADNKKREKRLNASTSKEQKAMTNQMNDLKGKV